jgi:hypothetical protein
MWPVFEDVHFLKQRYIHVEVWNRDRIGDEDLVGYGIISLKKAFSTKPTEFETTIYLYDEFCGTLTGDILGVPL